MAVVTGEPHGTARSIGRNHAPSKALRCDDLTGVGQRPLAKMERSVGRLIPTWSRSNSQHPDALPYMYERRRCLDVAGERVDAANFHGRSACTAHHSTCGANADRQRRNFGFLNGGRACAPMVTDLGSSASKEQAFRDLFRARLSRLGDPQVAQLAQAWRRLVVSPHFALSRLLCSVSARAVS